MTILLSMAIPAVAKSIVLGGPHSSNCNSVENIQVGVNFNNVPVVIADVASFIDQSKSNILAIATGLSIKSLKVENINFSVHSQGQRACTACGSPIYQLGGNLSFRMNNSSQAIKLVEALDKKGYRVNLNIQSYAQCH